MSKVVKTIEIEEENSIDKVIDFFRSKAGHASIILVSCVVLTILTTFLFADTINTIRGWDVAALLIGITFSIAFEVSVFFCAINGYVKASYLFAFFSLIIARATFERFSPDVELSFTYASTWIMSIAPVLIVLIASHKLAEKYKLETLVKAQQTESIHHNGVSIPAVIEKKSKNGSVVKS